jgi:hypothetical protein
MWIGNKWRSILSPFTRLKVSPIKLTGYLCLHRPFVSLRSALLNSTPFQKCENIIAMGHPSLDFYLYLLFPIAAQTITTTLHFNLRPLTSKTSSIIFSLKIEQWQTCQFTHITFLQHIPNTVFTISYPCLLVLKMTFFMKIQQQIPTLNLTCILVIIAHRTASDKQKTNLTFTGPCIIIYMYSKTNKMHQCIKFILFWNDTLHVSDGLSIHH